MSDWYMANIVLVQSTMTAFLLALSIQLPLRVGVFSFAGVGCYGIGGYAAAICMTRLEMPTWPSIAVGTLLAGVAGCLLGLLIQRLNGLYLGMATIAFTLIIAILAVNGGSLTGGAAGLFGALGDLTTGSILAVTLVVVVVFALSETGGLGRRIDAVREDPELAAAMGVDVSRYRRMSFLVSGLVGGLSGALTILLRSSITPAEVNFQLVVLALTVIVVGGFRSWAGALIGAVIFVWLPKALDFVGEWETVVYGVVVVLAALYLPGGVLGLATGLFRRLRSGRRGGAADGEQGAGGPGAGPGAVTGREFDELAVPGEGR